MEKYRRAGHATVDNMAHAHSMLASKATDTLRICTTYAFLLQRWLHAQALMLCYTYIACIVKNRPFSFSFQGFANKNHVLVSSLRAYPKYTESCARYAVSVDRTVDLNSRYSIKVLQ